MTPIGREPFTNGGIINMGAYGGTAEASKSYFGEPTLSDYRRGRHKRRVRGHFQRLYYRPKGCGDVAVILLSARMTFPCTLSRFFQ